MKDYEDMGFEERDVETEKHRQDMSEHRNKEKERKARTHRLIVIGGTVKVYHPELDGMNDDEIRSYVPTILKD